MQKLCLTLFVLLTATLAHAEIQPRGTDLGNAGDKIREVFLTARNVALDVLNLISQDDLKSIGLSNHSVALFGSRKLQLINDLEYSRAIWGAPQGSTTCMTTEEHGYNDVFLSFEYCRELHVIDASIELIAASLIHLGEHGSDAHEVARGIIAAFKSRAPTLYELLQNSSFQAPVDEPNVAMDATDLAGVFKSAGAKAVPLTIDSTGSLTWPVVFLYGASSYTLSVSQFLEKAPSKNIFSVTGHIQYQSVGSGGSLKNCSIPVELEITPDQSATKLKLIFVRPASIGGQCSSQGRVTEIAFFEKTGP